MKVSEIAEIIESEFPLSYQENYDNSGLLIGDPHMNVSSALLCVDVTEEVISEAIHEGAGIIISHHPAIFRPVKNIAGNDITTRIIKAAVKNDIAVYAAHTNVDNLYNGVNNKLCSKLGLSDIKILSPLQGQLNKLITYVPHNKAEEVREALFNTGAGNIGNYDSCSFNVEGRGSFRASEGTHPYTGSIGKLHYEDETRIETVFPEHLRKKVIHTLLSVHPYEEVAYDIFALENSDESAGAGMIGELAAPVTEKNFLASIKKVLKCPSLRHSRLLGEKIKRVAVCGGSGSFLIGKAVSARADIFITSDVKYHQFFEADNKLIIVDAGHFETEQFTIEIFYEILQKKLPNFAIRFSSINTSPIYYY